MSENTPKKGVDVSYANPKADFAKLKAAGVSFAIIRTGYRQKTDDLFRSHMKNALAAGLDVGAYTYCMAKTPDEARKEAAYAIELVKDYKLTYPLCYDMEDASISELSKTKLTNIAEAFLSEVKKAGLRPALYANPSWLLNKLNKDKLLKEYDLWLAHWTNSPENVTKYQYGQTMWQWGAEEIDGSGGKIDCDLCYTDYPDIIGKSAPAPEVKTKFTPKINDTVLFSGGYHYGSATIASSTGYPRTAGTARVSNVSLGSPHPYHLIGGGTSNVYGWVDEKTVYSSADGKAAVTTAALKLRKSPTSGDAVAVIPKGAGFIALSEPVSGRIKAAYNGAEGYVSEEYVKIL